VKSLFEASVQKAPDGPFTLRTETKSAALLVVLTSVQPISSAPEPGMSTSIGGSACDRPRRGAPRCQT
jgi:hypothetical protein